MTINMKNANILSNYQAKFEKFLRFADFIKIVKVSDFPI